MVARVEPQPQQPNKPRVVCAWCKVLLRPGFGPESHGICPHCADDRFKLTLIGVPSEQHDEIQRAS